MTDITNIESLDELSEVFDEHGWMDSENEEGDKEMFLEVTRELSTTFSIYQDDSNCLMKEIGKSRFLDSLLKVHV